MKGPCAFCPVGADGRTAVAFGAEDLQTGVNALLASHNTMVLTRSNSTFFSAPAATQSIQLTANLLASTGNNALIRGGFLSGEVLQTGTVRGASTDRAAPDNLAAPNFWPTPTWCPGWVCLAGGMKPMSAMHRSRFS